MEEPSVWTVDFACERWLRLQRVAQTCRQPIAGFWPCPRHAQHQAQTQTGTQRTAALSIRCWRRAI